MTNELQAARLRGLTRRGVLERGGAAALTGTALAACGPFRAPAPPKLDAQVKVVHWGGNVQGVWPHMQPLFAQLYPKVTVQAEGVTRQQGQRVVDAILAALAAGAGPDSFGTDATPTFMLPYVVRNSVLPLDSYFTRLPNLKKIFAWCRRIATINGKTWAVSFSAAYVGVFANATVLSRAGIRKPPETWAEFLDQARTLRATLADRKPSGPGTTTQAEEKPPVPMMLNIPNNAGDFFSLLRAAVLGKHGIDEMLYRSGKWDSAEMIQVAQTARDLQAAGVVPPSPMADHWVGPANFANGNAAWWPQGTWGVAGFERIKLQNPGQFDFTHFPLPGVRGSLKPQFVGRIVGGMMLNSATKVAAAAAALTDFLISLPAMKIWIERTPGELPGPVIPFDPSDFSVSPGARTALENLAKAGDMPPHIPEMVSDTLRDYEQQTMMELLNGKTGPRDYGTLLQTRWEEERKEGKLPTQQLQAR